MKSLLPYSCSWVTRSFAGSSGTVAWGIDAFCLELLTLGTRGHYRLDQKTAHEKPLPPRVEFLVKSMKNYITASFIEVIFDHSPFLLRWTKNLSSYLGSYYKWYSLYNSSRKRWNEDDGNDDDSPHDPFYSRCSLFAPNIDAISPPPRSLERRLFLQATRLNYFSSKLHFVQKLKLPYALHLYLSYFIYTFHRHNATFYGGVHKTSNSSFSFWT